MSMGEFEAGDRSQFWVGNLGAQWSSGPLSVAASIGFLGSSGQGLTYTGFGMHSGGVGVATDQGGGMMGGRQPRVGGAQDPRIGLGDALLASRFSFWRPTIDSQWSIMILAKVPLADPDVGLGTGEWDFSGEVEMSFRALGGSTSLAGGILLIGDPAGLAYRDPVTARVAWMHPINRGGLLGSLDMRWASRIVEDLPGPLELGVGIGGYRADGKLWLARLQVGLTGGAPAFGISVSGSLTR
jgi:hypothetical protein